MARRTVTATFAGGMISDEPKPGTARYLENLVPRVDGVIPCNPGKNWLRAATSISTANGVTTASIADGWSAGGTVHPKIGLVALMDVVKATATATYAARLAFTSGFGMAGSPGTTACRTLVVGADVETANGIPNLLFADHGGLTPIVQSSFSYTTGSGFMTPGISGRKLGGHQTFINIEDEVLLVGKGTTAERIYRYAGATGNTGLTTSISDGAVAAFGSASGMATVSSTGTATWDNKIVVYGDIATAASATGMYVGLIMGVGLETTAGTSTHTIREFMITATGAVIGTGSTASREIQIDRRVLLSSAVFCRCIIGNTAQLMSSQIARSTATQPFAKPTGSQLAFLSGSHNPSGRSGAAYHQGRLWLADKSKLSWSGTVDETLQMTATGSFSSSSAATGVTTASTATYGIEYKHISLYSTASYLNIFPHIGGDIVGLVSMTDGLLIMKRGGLFRLVGSVSYDGESNAVDLQVVSNSVGPESEFSWSETPAGVVFTWNDGIWLYDGNEIQEISRGSVSNSFVENVRMHRQSNTGLGLESVATRVCSDGDYVFFTPMRYTMSTASGIEPAFASSMHSGLSIHNKHLVLAIRDQKWYYISQLALNVPSAILPIRSSRGSKYSNYWLNSWKPYTAAGTAVNTVHIADIQNLLHESGPSKGLAVGTGSWLNETFSAAYGAAVSHPLISGVDTVRPRSALLKHTNAVDYGGSSTSTSLGDNKVTLIDSQASFVPASSAFMTYYGSTGTISGIPEWWAGMATGSSLASDTNNINDNARSRWEVEGTTSTARAVSILDKITLSNNETAMSSPTIFYYDDFWWRDRESTTTRYQNHILHEAGIEFDEVENRSDR